MIIPFVNILSFILMGILKKGNLTGFHTNSFNGSGFNSNGTYFNNIIPCLEFSIEFQSNNLIYHKEYTKRQQIIYVLIKPL